MIFQSKEYLVRLACAPRKWIFFKAPLNLVGKKQTAIESHCQQKQHYHHCHHHDVSKVDLLAILPYFVSFVMEELKVTVEYDHDHHANDIMIMLIIILMIIMFMIIILIIISSYL